MSLDIFYTFLEIASVNASVSIHASFQTPSFDLPLEVIKGPTAFYASSSSSSPPYSAAAVNIKSEPETATPAAMQTEPTATASPAETKPKPSTQNPPSDAPPSKTPVLRTDKEQHAAQGTSSAPSTSQKVVFHAFATPHVNQEYVGHVS